MRQLSVSPVPNLKKDAIIYSPSVSVPGVQSRKNDAIPLKWFNSLYTNSIARPSKLVKKSKFSGVVMLTNHTYLMFHQKNGKMVCSFFTFQMFCSSHFLFLDSFGDEVTKIRKCYVIFVCILQGKTGKTQNENHATKVTKIPKTIRRKYGMNETHVYSKN